MIIDKINGRYHVLLAALIAPFLFVTIPPLVDVPGHTAAAAIEIASPGSTLARYYSWQWTLNLNMAGEVFLKCLGPVLGTMWAGWLLAVLATLVVGAGAVAVAKALNPRGNHAIGWALIFVLGFPWVWGFLNYQIAVGGALLSFAASLRLLDRPRQRVALLAIAQPLLLICHGIGGMLLPVLVLCERLGHAIEDSSRPEMFTGALRKGLSECLVLAISPLAIMAITLGKRSSGLAWQWHAKLGFPLEVLRDQNRALDIGSTGAALLILLAGPLLGARWRWRCALPSLALMGMYAVMPARINGSEACDVRLLSVAIMVGLALQDWRRARAGIRMCVFGSGLALLLVRLIFVVTGFIQYDRSYQHELMALDHVRQGSRMLVLVRHDCLEQEWRATRLDHIPALASVRKGVWINNHWTLPGLDMMQSRFDPTRGQPARMSSMVWDKACLSPGRRTVDDALAMAPRMAVDYVWLVDTGAPRAFYPDLRPIWNDGRSFLYAIQNSRSPTE